MNRRDFLKSGAATLASMWIVTAKKECVIAEEPQEEKPVEEESIEWPERCEECFMYCCSADCPNWVEDGPYFVSSTTRRLWGIKKRREIPKYSGDFSAT